jgi:hypothetical protein
MSTSPELRVVESYAEFNDDPLIAPGEYRGVYVRHETLHMRMFGGAPKVYVHCRIVDPGEAFGAVLYRSYRVKALSSKPGRNGVFKVNKRSDLFMTVCRLSTRKLRPDRLCLHTLLSGHVLTLKVRTVTKDWRGRPLPEILHYSVIQDIVGAET